MGCGSSSQSVPTTMEHRSTNPDGGIPTAATAAGMIASSPRPPPPPPPQPPAPGTTEGEPASARGPPKLDRKPSLLERALAEPVLPSQTAPLNLKSTKIVATLGPASTAPEMLESLMKAGVNVFRLNFSHSSDHGNASLLPYLRDSILSYCCLFGIIS
jgi:hypothetical protein